MNHNQAPSNRSVVVRAAAVALFAIVLAVFIRLQWVEHQELTVNDLAEFEAVSGLDLPSWYDETPFFLGWTRGDGATYVALAMDLDTNEATQRLGRPGYRYLRVGYAWMARAAALGSTDLVPIGLFVVNVGALSLLSLIALRLHERVGARAYLLFANPAVTIAFLTDTAELVAVTALAASFMASRRGSLAGGVVVAITRPSLIPSLAARGSNVLPVLTAAMGASGLVALRAAAAFDGLQATTGNVTWPVVGYISTVQSLPLAEAVALIGLAAAAIATVGVGLRRARGWVRIGWVASGLLVLMLGEAVLPEVGNWARAAAALPVLWAFGPEVGYTANEAASRPAHSMAME